MRLLEAGPGGASDINNGGAVVGGGGSSAYRWSVEAGFESLGIAAQNTFANAINNAGIVAGAAGIESCNTGPMPWDAPGRTDPSHIPRSR